jgi:hypothetical protein
VVRRPGPKSRRGPRWCKVAISACLLVFHTHAGHARGGDSATAVGAPVAPEQAEAKARFLRGLALATEGRDWNAALAEFLESRRLYPTKSATHNAAFALGKLGRFVEAVAMYDGLFAEFANQLTTGEARAFARERAASLARVGELQIDIAQPNANIVIDGVQRGETPFPGSIRLDEGRHTLRLSKDGFVPIELELQMAGGQHRVFQGALNRASQTGTLVVRESRGQQLDVLVDSARVGQTPWQGELSTGTHLVLLLGPRRLGSPPNTTEIRAGQTTSLTLQAVELSSSLRIEPSPTNSSVFVNDIAVGNGVWVGRLPAGRHRIDVIAAGHLPFRQELWLTPGQDADVRVPLERDAENPLWKTIGKIPLLVELSGGALVSPSLSGGADDACGCRERSRPHGFVAGVRVGYLATSRLALELGVSYLSISEAMTRTVRGQGEPSSPSFTATDYRDSTRLRGPLGMFSVSYRMLRKTPLTARIGGGVARLHSDTRNSGTYSGEIVNHDLDERQTLSMPVSIGEASRSFFVPFASTELRFGYQFSRVFSADIGAALTIFFPPEVPRGGTDTAGSDQIRGTVLPSTSTWSDGSPVVPGRMTLPRETIAGPFIALAPTIAVQARF